MERLRLPRGLLGTGCPAGLLGPCDGAMQAGGQSWAGWLSALAGDGGGAFDSSFLTGRLPERSLSRAGLGPQRGEALRPPPAPRPLSCFQDSSPLCHTLLLATRYPSFTCLPGGPQGQAGVTVIPPVLC